MLNEDELKRYEDAVNRILSPENNEDWLRQMTGSEYRFATWINNLVKEVRRLQEYEFKYKGLEK